MNLMVHVRVKISDLNTIAKAIDQHFRKREQTKSYLREQKEATSSKPEAAKPQYSIVRHIIQDNDVFAILEVSALDLERIRNILRQHFNALERMRDNQRARRGVVGVSTRRSTPFPDIELLDEAAFKALV